MTMPPSGDQPAYVDPVTGQPLFIDPATGQLAYTDPTAVQAPSGYPPVPTYPPTAPVYPGYEGYAPPPGATEPAAPGAQPYAMPTAAYGQPSGIPDTGFTTPAYPANPYGQPGAVYPGYGYPAGYLQPRTNPMSIASMVVSLCALLGLVCYGVLGLIAGVVGAILGHVARRQIRSRGENGSGMALTGIIVGWIATAIGIAIVVFFIVLVVHISHDNDNYPN